MIIATYIDLIKNEIRNALFQNLGVDPGGATPGEGRFYWNTGTKRVRVYNGTTWDELSIAGGSVTSVGLSLPSIFNVSGSPVTSTGTLTGTLANQAANTIFAGPNLGAAAAPTFRSLVQADIPNTIPLSYWAPAAADINLGGFKITNLANPTTGSDAANKTYVDNLFQGARDYKESVRLASTANVTVTYNATGGTSTRGQITAAPNTLNGTTLVVGDRILLKDQTNAAQNGIWTVTTVGTGSNGVWDRATDFDSDIEVTSGLMTYVTNHTTVDNRGTYYLTTSDPITIGGASGTSLSFVQIAAPTGYTAGAGLTQTGFTFDVVSTNTGIAVGANDITLTLASNSGLQIASGLKILSDTTTVNTIGLTLTGNGAGFIFNTTSFTDSGSETLALASTVAGDGLSLTTGALSVNVDNSTIELSTDALRVKAAGITANHINSSALGSTLTGGSGTPIDVANYTPVSGTTIARKYASAITISTGSYTQTVTHNLASSDVQVYIYETTTNNLIWTEVTHTSTNVVTITGTNNSGAVIPARCVVVG